MQLVKDNTVVKIITFTNGFSVIGRIPPNYNGLSYGSVPLQILEPMMVTTNPTTGKMMMDALLSYSDDNSIKVDSVNVVTVYSASTDLATYYDIYARMHREFILPILKANMSESVAEMEKSLEKMIEARTQATH